MLPSCMRCRRHFTTTEALAEHLRTSQAHHICRTSVVDFPLRASLVQHYVLSPLHHYCQRCDAHHASAMALISHLEAAHNQCLWCGLVFATPKDLDAHYRYLHAACLECRQVHGTPAALEVHLRAAHWYCAPCRRVFKNSEALKVHLEFSRAHRGCTVLCPGVGCTKAFASGPAVVQHLESGGCRSGMERRAVNRRAVRLDADNIITDPARLLAVPGGYAPPEQSTPRATERSRNPASGEYECCVCGAGFKKLEDLNNYLESPVHDEKIYRCPTVWRGCGMEFGTLSALCQHVESGSCGARRFGGGGGGGGIEKDVGSLVGGGKRLAL
ncbi:hypothetical protein DAEQUDRAFT_767287 [Daedalea quercina L-15889]|uniref:C2H2-type domain-containing protein n=1 Tax=Daedalea quercina L-15889 TaxID=1314783 RepID=A0A165NUC2_9APHY|nr:hypothetical protein DAEQUDRAFT_767287 [Daedalea quercina L-15889]